MTKTDILDLIKGRWPETTRCNKENKGDLIGLPYPYTVPCIKDNFQELYYWDTYFTSRGMMMQGFAEQVRNNCDNFIYEVNKFGFIPNGNRTFYLNRSQPPYFGALIELVYKHFKDKKWLSAAVDALEKEYLFWTSRRGLDCGLIRYGHHAKEDCIFEEFYKVCCVGRIKMDNNPDPEIRRYNGAHTIAEAESGWDFNPRFERRCMDYAPIDLNSIIFYDEVLLEYFHKELNNPEKAARWASCAKQRKDLINRLCWNEKRGVFLDYDTKNNKLAPIFSAASLQPLWAGLATPEQAASTVKEMEKYLEYAHGISTCEKYDSGFNYHYQWDYPNGWPCMQMIAIDSLSRYGYKSQAKRIAEKYINNVIRCFESSGEIWEKYNIETGTIDVKGEYHMPSMMGWSAAAFVIAAEYVSSN